MKDFIFRGEIPASKSLLNRALIIQSYFPALHIQGQSRCDDVTFMRNALAKIQNPTGQNLVLDCGEGGTTLRFLAARVSRIPGKHLLTAHPRLLQRPHQELEIVFKQLGVFFRQTEKGIEIETRGWKVPADVLKIDCSRSSQFASAIVLSSGLLDFDLKIELVGKKVSESYLEMTLEFMEDLGWQIERHGDFIHIPKNQRPQKLDYLAEPDLSSAFSIAAAGALFGKTEILNFPAQSSQPDLAFVEILKRMGADVNQDSLQLNVEKKSLRAVECELSQSPDLFPVLAVLCGFAEGRSRLHGASQLVHKESDRIALVSELLTQMNVKHQVLPDGMEIQGGIEGPTKAFDFNPDHDHRMVMAATLYRLAGFPVRVLHPEAVNKSLPEYFEMIGLKP